MPRRRAAWILTVPLSVVGSQLAHEAAYRLVYPKDGTRAGALAETGHAYFAYLPLVFALGTVIALLGLVELVRDPVRASRPRLWMFAAIAPAVFVVQEHLERALAGDGFPWAAATDKTFLAGLALQLPVAALAWLVARLLVRIAVAVLGGIPRARGRRTSSCPWPGHLTLALLPVLLASGHGSRGPPALTA